MNNRNTLNKIIGSQDLNKVESVFLFKYVFIPLAWPISWLFIVLGISPNQATFIRLIIIIVSYLLILLHSDYVFISFLLIYISLILDCVDGQISRTKGSSTYYGKFFDGLIDSCLEITWPIIIAIAYYKINKDFSVLLFGSTASLFYALYVNVIIRSSNALSNSGIKVSEEEYKNKLPFLIKNLYVYSNKRLLWDVFDVKYFIFPFFYFLDFINEFLKLFCVINLLILLIFLFFRIHQCYYFLNVKRKSKTLKTFND